MNLRFSLKQCLIALFFTQASFCSHKLTSNLQTIQTIDPVQIAALNEDLSKYSQELANIKKELKSNNPTNEMIQKSDQELNDLNQKLYALNKKLRIFKNAIDNKKTVFIDEKIKNERTAKREQQQVLSDLGLSTAKSFWTDITNEQTQGEEQQQA